MYSICIFLVLTVSYKNPLLFGSLERIVTGKIYLKSLYFLICKVPVHVSLPWSQISCSWQEWRPLWSSAVVVHPRQDNTLCNHSLLNINGSSVEIVKGTYIMVFTWRRTSAKFLKTSSITKKAKQRLYFLRRKVEESPSPTIHPLHAL